MLVSSGSRSPSSGLSSCVLHLTAYLFSPQTVTLYLMPSHKPVCVAFSLSAPIPPEALRDDFIERGHLVGTALTWGPLWFFLKFLLSYSPVVPRAQSPVLMSCVSWMSYSPIVPRAQSPVLMSCVSWMPRQDSQPKLLIFMAA